MSLRPVDIWDSVGSGQALSSRDNRLPLSVFTQNKNRIRAEMDTLRGRSIYRRCSNEICSEHPTKYVY